MPAPPTHPPKLGRYEVVSRVAMGGMAELLLGKLQGPSGFERAVAIKRILPHYAQHPSFVQMFLDEGRLAARIGHPNVVQVHELGQEGEDLYLVMEYLQGESAAGVLRRLHARGELLPPALAVHVVASACAGLHAAHELKGPDGRALGLVHRDVSPGNLFVSYDGTVKVLDFGIAMATDRVSHTEQGAIKGKLEYMSPEQARGETLDRRSDVFSLGTVLHELLTRRRLFRRANPAATWNAVCSDQIVPPSRAAEGVPLELDAICLRALARDPAQRYASAQLLRRALLDWLHAGVPGAPPEEMMAALMERLFADRIADKHRVVDRLREGALPGALPDGEVDVGVDLPSVVDPAPPTTVARPPAPPRPARARAALWVMGAAAVLGATFIALAKLRPARPSGAAAPAPLVAAAAPPVQAPMRVSVSVESTPPGATVWLGGVERGVTPLSVELEASLSPTVLRLEREGRLPVEEQLVPDVSQRLKYSLELARPAVRARAPVPKPPPPQSPRLEPEEAAEPRPEPSKFRRFN